MYRTRPLIISTKPKERVNRNAQGSPSLSEYRSYYCSIHRDFDSTRSKEFKEKFIDSPKKWCIAASEERTQNTDGDERRMCASALFRIVMRVFKNFLKKCPKKFKNPFLNVYI